MVDPLIFIYHFFASINFQLFVVLSNISFYLSFIYRSNSSFFLSTRKYQIKMCPLFYLLLLCICISPLLICCSAAGVIVWKAKFKPEKLWMTMETYNTTELTLENIPLELLSDHKAEMQLISQNKDRVKVDESFQVIKVPDSTWIGNVTVNGLFLGQSEVYVRLRKPGSSVTEEAKEKLDVIVTRHKRIIDHVFTGTVALLVSILYINFGAALDMKIVKSILLRPIGPAIGFCGQFLLMPLIAYGLGEILLQHIFF